MFRHPVFQLCWARLLEFVRRPEALFWTYGFPLVMLFALGTAFRSTAPPPVAIELRGAKANILQERLKSRDLNVNVTNTTDEDWKRRLQSGKVAAVVEVDDDDQATIWLEPSRPESTTALLSIRLAMSSADEFQYSQKQLTDRGNRYIDFLVPGMMALNLMGGGLWGVGFLIVTMRIRKLLKRLLATPLSLWHFMGSIVIMRLLFAIIEQSVIFAYSYFAFGVRCEGNPFELIVILVLGGMTFSSIGLLLASRAETNEAISGLMNLIMLPMWIFGGVFFSTERFPEGLQAFLELLPFVAMVNAIRSIMLDGASLASLGQNIVVMMTWFILCLCLAIKFFKWK